MVFMQLRKDQQRDNFCLSHPLTKNRAETTFFKIFNKKPCLKGLQKLSLAYFQMRARGKTKSIDK